MTLPHGFNDPTHTNPRETCKKCNPQRRTRIAVDGNGNMNCFDKIFELRRQKCYEDNCRNKCVAIIKGKETDKFYCKHHLKLHKDDFMYHSWFETFSFRYELAKLLVLLGFVKESKNA